MKWINILHLYQPPTQSKEIIDRVVHESYETILSLLEKYRNLKLTLNISGSLLELLIKYGHSNIIKRFRSHAERGAVEFLGSAMYHPILPLLDEREIARQIELNNKISKECFGDVYQPRGFYFPEMAYSHDAGLAVKKAGFAWTVLDEIHTNESIDVNTKYTVLGVGLDVIFRDSRYSKTFPPESIVENLGKIGREIIVICHDGELYGHWHSDDRGYYEKAFTHPNITTVTASEYIANLTAKKEILVRDASWESQPEELLKNIPLGLWQDPLNRIHILLESLKRSVLILVENNQDNPGYDKARYHADRGVASCAWWWASERKIGPFSPVSWNPTEIQKGVDELRQARECLVGLAEDEVSQIRMNVEELKSIIWKNHKDKYDQNYNAEL